MGWGGGGKFKVFQKACGPLQLMPESYNLSGTPPHVDNMDILQNPYQMNYGNYGKQGKATKVLKNYILENRAKQLWKICWKII